MRFPTNWDVQPPRELWRRRVGPGWSSFAVVGERLFTQEQRGGEESIVCYDALSGEELWTADADARFYRVESGAGPLGTPTFFDGALYANGATGVVQRVDAATGSLAWRRQLTEDLPRNDPPQWGFASSPLVVDTDRGALAIVFAGNARPAPAATRPIRGRERQGGDRLRRRHRRAGLDRRRRLRTATARPTWLSWTEYSRC